MLPVGSAAPWSVLAEEKRSRAQALALGEPAERPRRGAVTF